MSERRGPSLELLAIVFTLAFVLTQGQRVKDLESRHRKAQAAISSDITSLRTRLAAAELAALLAMDQANLAYEDAGAAHQRLEYLREQVVFAFSSIDSRRTRLARPYPDPPRPSAIMAPVCYAEDLDVAP